MVVPEFPPLRMLAKIIVSIFLFQFFSVNFFPSVFFAVLKQKKLRQYSLPSKDKLFVPIITRT